MDSNKLPDDYKRGFKDFLNCKIDLSHRPLIPREETEDWVKKAIEEIKNCSKKEIKCLDIFSGSGCIGIAVLKNIPECVCDFAEIEDIFLEQIKINLKLNSIDLERVKIIKSDIFSNISSKYDFILANPPYVAEERISELGEDVKQYEPSIALMGGKLGMDFIKMFLQELSNYLDKDGIAYMEIDPQQEKIIKEILLNNHSLLENYDARGNYRNFEFLADQFGKIRVLKIYPVK